MNTYQEQLQKHLPDIQEFLTSLFLEDTKITITIFEETQAEETSAKLRDNDIVLYTRDEALEIDVFAILDEEWFGLLSSVMLGVEEKKFNEVTKDLLKNFSGELTETLKKKLAEEGLETGFGEVDVFQLNDLEELQNHTNYFYGEMEVEGLADDKVRAAILIGDPEAQKVVEEAEEPEEIIEEEDGEVLEETLEEEPELPEETLGAEEEVISAKYIEFEDFEDTPAFENENGNSMDLLKDVEMDVSVELGRIELPLGKVLQLSKGSVIELEKLAGEPVDILVNGQRIAHGEVVVIDEHFGVRISNLITTRQRLATLS
ncbi:MAG: flagellar motor switch protein FliN [Balneola sp.]|nr:flagellar motor switch protein FliN [Balneola sp.]|tara:strand:+ start:65389 stop:66339 length:951 start_codon:yes stop_codon:yes gene_type:complete